MLFLWRLTCHPDGEGRSRQHGDMPIRALSAPGLQLILSGINIGCIFTALRPHSGAADAAWQ